MPYSLLNIWNRGLASIGVPRISSITSEEEASEAIREVWDSLRDEVLESEDWVFAKTRKELSKSSTTPVQGFDYAYPLPSDFLKLWRNNSEDPPVYPNGVLQVNFATNEIVLQGRAYNYLIEALEDGTPCLFTDYNDTSEPLVIQYIRREVNPARYSAHFVSCVAYRIGMEVGLELTASLKRVEKAEQKYFNALRLAKGHNRSGDREDDTGSTDWLFAGR